MIDLPTLFVAVQGLFFLLAFLHAPLWLVFLPTIVLALSIMFVGTLIALWLILVWVF